MNRAQVAAAYKSIRRAERGKSAESSKRGNRIALKGVDIQIIASAGQAISKPLKGRGRAECGVCGTSKNTRAEQDPDNDQSVGFLLKIWKIQIHRYGRLDLELRAEVSLSE